jgi:hypothetical protein
MSGCDGMRGIKIKCAEMRKQETEMLKAIVSYSKKIPVPDSQFSSQSYSVSLETEITATDAAAIQGKLHETFELVKSQVESELAHGGAHAERPADRSAPSGKVEKASNKQIKFITDLATQKMSLAELNEDVRKRFNVGGIYDLSRKQASQLLDELNGRKAA